MEEGLIGQTGRKNIDRHEYIVVHDSYPNYYLSRCDKWLPPKQKQDE